MNKHSIRVVAPVALLILLSGCTSSGTGKITYPAAKTVAQTDIYFGTPVADPYRWLEDDESADTQAFVSAENALTRQWVDTPQRAALKAKLVKLWDYPKVSAPAHRGDWYTFTKNTGLQNQSITYARKSLDAEPHVLFDPNLLAADGTGAIGSTRYTRDGGMVAYGISFSGSDQQEIRVRDVATAQDTADRLRYCKFASVAWSPDNKGFWYNKYPDPGTVAREDQARFNKLYWHTLGTEQSADKLVYEPADKDLSCSPAITDDGKYLLLRLSRGSTPRNRVYYRDASTSGQFIKLLDAEDASYNFIDNVGSVFYFTTDLDAPRNRVIAIDVNNPAKANWKEIVPQQKDTLSGVTVVNNELVCRYTRDAYTVLMRVPLSGGAASPIALPGLGTASLAPAERDDTVAFINYSSFVDPPTVYRYDFATNSMSVYLKSEAKVDPSKYESKQVFVTSTDGTRVPMFITHRKGLKLDGNNPTLLGGYGGFRVSQSPGFSVTRCIWMDMGGVSATACLRGGGEYGEEWHRAGMLANKQNVFDDFISCAKWLCDNGYTQPKKLAIQGGSNGGLLVAACLNQAPQQFGAVVCQVPLTDMLRYHRFTVGRFWIPEYGNADASASDFTTLRAYSPLHNIQKGAQYPPTLITTGDTDDRVAPLHPRKFAAALQAEVKGGPILLRVEEKAGHGGGKPTTKQINETADIYAFLMKALGIKGQ